MARAAEEAAAADEGEDVDLGEVDAGEGDRARRDRRRRGPPVAGGPPADGPAPDPRSRTRQVRPGTDGVPARRGSAHRALQLALRPAPRRHVRAAHRGHRTRHGPAANGSSGIQDTLRWLGLDWDEGPYLQSDRLDQYAPRPGRLLQAGRAYECFCTPEEVKARSDAAMKAGSPAGLRRPVPRPHRRRAGGARGGGPPAIRSGSARPTPGSAPSRTSCGARSASSGPRSRTS